MPRGLKFLNFRKYGKFRTEISGLTEPSCRLFSSYFSATFPPILGVSSTIIAAAAVASSFLRPAGRPLRQFLRALSYSLGFKMTTCKFITSFAPGRRSIGTQPPMAAPRSLSTRVISYPDRRSVTPTPKAGLRKLCVPAVDLYKVKLVSPKGVEHEFDAPGDACILDSAETAGLELPYSCRAGDCSTCAGRIEDGVVDQPNGSYLDDAQRADGYVLTCVSYPRSNCVIHTHKGREV
uniref:Ferredoxin n=1 Tax=Oryza barthii TaxID=65489 RepID=A0A0D3GP78_9ORYZ